ncbi:hypothetical protein UCDDS831_g07738 [Diplodia seriata]|uniref:Uncharacterized protein n=1 Tax=Diplodia seriata TaxID=420778 RepID=A0A0G2FTP3_9PEZI|nr:hypothetical protein UCDDS831_g07738 [Diplodia seriata]
MLEPESKEMTIYGARREQKKTESATIDYLNASLDGADPMTWKSSYVELGLPTNYWDQPIVCLVAAIHIFCNMSPPSQNPDPTIWRSILAILLQGITPGSDLPPCPTNNKAGEAKQDADVNPANFSVPPTRHSLPIQTYLAHMTKALADFHARHRERVAQLRNLAAHTADAKALTDRLAHPSHLNSQRLAYERRQGEMRALVEQTENMMATLTRMRAAVPASATMKELTRCVEGARAVERADAVRMERLERFTKEREVVGGLVVELADKAAWRARRLDENWVGLWGKLEGEYGRMQALFGPPPPRAGGAAA